MLRAITRLLRMTKSTRNDPVVFVTGCTGTGKSDLGIAIAEKYGGEVISADSMQIYKGLDIVTNKVTEEETKGVPHHLMSFLDPGVLGYNVQDFQQSALRLVEDIRSRGKIPIIVGGTAYYVEGVLFEDNMIKTDRRSDLSQLEDRSNEELHALLKEVDPVSANLVHPNNRARVRRALDIYYLTGRPKSELVREQHERNGSQGRPRFENILVLTMDASTEVLDKRLDSRVGKMVARGLRKELEEFYDQHREDLETISHGVLQCIGPKEFLPYLRLPKELRNTEESEGLWQTGCSDLELHTRQYARKQRKWVKSRFYGRYLGEQVTIRTVDSSDKDTFIDSGLAVFEAWLSGDKLPDEENKGTFIHSRLDGNLVFECLDCERKISGKACWEEHLKGRSHRKTVAAKKRRQNKEAAK